MDSLIKTIIDRIKSITDENWERLSPMNSSVVAWNSMSAQEVVEFVSSVKDVLIKLPKYEKSMRSVSLPHLRSVEKELRALIKSIESFSSLNYDSISSEHHQALEHLANLNNSLRNLGLFTEIKLSPDISETIKKLERASDTLDKFDKNLFDDAITLVDDLISKKNTVDEQVIKEHLGTYIKNANTHRIYNSKIKFLSRNFSGNWWWLVLALSMGTLVALVVFSFISTLQSENDITAGAAILRVSALIVPSYFMVFFINQFIYHQKMYEVYTFKNTSMGTMVELMKTNPNMAEEILNRGLNVLFNEPKIREDNKYDQQLVTELLSILKSKT